MVFKVITSPTKAFQNAISEENLGAAVATAVLAGILFGIAGFLITGNLVQFAVNFAVPIVQWIVISVIAWIFYFMFRKKKLGELSLAQIASATGELWTLFVILGVIIAIGAYALTSFGNIGIILPVSLVLFGIITIIGLIFLVDWFIMVKTMLEAENKKAFVVWILMVITHGLLFLFINSALNAAVLPI
jgi:hypothetical protein